jgi:hypothetical protein
VQTYRACMGIMKLSKSHTSEVMEKACQEALAKKVCAYKYFSVILKQLTLQTPQVKAEASSSMRILEGVEPIWGWDPCLTTPQ